MCEKSLSPERSTGLVYFEHIVQGVVATGKARDVSRVQVMKGLEYHAKEPGPFFFLDR